MLTRLFSIFALIMLLASCDVQVLTSLPDSAEPTDYAKSLYAKLTSKDFESIEPQLSSRLRTPGIRSRLEQMAATLPQGPPKHVQTLGSRVFAQRDVTHYEFAFEYEYAQRWVIAEIAFEDRNNKRAILVLRVTPRTQSLADEHAFTLAGKSTLHYVSIVSLFAIPLFIALTMLLCAKSPIRERKWLWMLFIAFGVVQFQFNWSTGAWGINPLYVQLFGAGFNKFSEHAPLIIALSFPLGAVMFLIKRRSMLVAPTTDELAPSPPTEEVTPR